MKKDLPKSVKQKQVQRKKMKTEAKVKLKQKFDYKPKKREIDNDLLLIKRAKSLNLKNYDVLFVAEKC